jgi:cobyric acid synthase/histidinol-phosphate/aromatic aminotransferase/cobyric acid decarboxylase-like protein
LGSGELARDAAVNSDRPASNTEPAASPIRFDFSATLNPLGMPPRLPAVLVAALADLDREPPPNAEPAARALALAHGVRREQLLVGSGLADLIGCVLAAIRPVAAGWLEPCVPDYAEACRAAGVAGSALATASEPYLFAVPLERLPETLPAVLFLASPNNPTGATIPPGAVADLCAQHPDTTVVLDESYADFLPDAEARSWISRDMPPNLVVVKGLAAFSAAPGLRLAFACASQPLAARLAAAQMPGSVSALALAAAAELYRDAEHTRFSRAETARLRLQLAATLGALPGWRVFPSEASFVLASLPPAWTAPRLDAELRLRGLCLCPGTAFPGLAERHVRLAVRPADEVQALGAALAALPGLPDVPALSPAPAPTPSLLLVGATRQAGVSLVATALCRWFAKRGRHVAPFRACAQTLDAYLTRDGGELSRAQMLQAQAAGLEPHTDMNPVLLRPVAEGTPPAAPEPDARAVEAAYRRLADRHDLIVAQATGGGPLLAPGRTGFDELALAEATGARALLVAHAGRGGVAAQVFGSLQLLPPRARRLFAGVLVNGVRQGRTELERELRDLEPLIGLPVLGLLPHIPNLALGREAAGAAAPLLDVLVVRTPGLSNSTDFLPLESAPGVRLRYVDSPADWGQPDCVIVPDSRRVRDDLRFLRESGLNLFVVAAADDGLPVLGIGAGYALLGTTIEDPDGVGGKAGSDAALGLLPVRTVLASERPFAPIHGRTLHSFVFAAPDTPFEGYESRPGLLEPLEPLPPSVRLDARRGADVGEDVGAVSANGLVVGLPVHGLFDSDTIRPQFIEWLCRWKGLEPDAPPPAPLSREQIFDELAEWLQGNADMARIEALVRPA